MPIRLKETRITANLVTGKQQEIDVSKMQTAKIAASEVSDKFKYSLKKQQWKNLKARNER